MCNIMLYLTCSGNNRDSNVNVGYHQRQVYCAIMMTALVSVVYSSFLANTLFTCVQSHLSVSWQHLIYKMSAYEITVYSVSVLVIIACFLWENSTLSWVAVSRGLPLLCLATHASSYNKPCDAQMRCCGQSRLAKYCFCE